MAVQPLLTSLLYLRSEMQAKKVGSEIISLLGRTESMEKGSVDLDLDSRGLSW